MGGLAGRRLLVVEDEAVVLLLLEDLLVEFGCVVTAVATRLGEAMELAQGGGFDLALLDVNLAGERVYPVADILQARGVPFLFVTGYGSSGLREDLKAHHLLAKPFTSAQLHQRLLELVGG